MCDSPSFSRMDAICGWSDTTWLLTKASASAFGDFVLEVPVPVGADAVASKRVRLFGPFCVSVAGSVLILSLSRSIPREASDRG